MMKDPDAELDYSWDWTAWLADAETITTATVTVAPAGLTVEPATHAAGVVTAWMSGGTVGTRYQATCRVTTNQGRTDDRTMTIDVQQQ